MRHPRKSGKILFVCHVASQSGAPLLLLEIIKEYKHTSNGPFNILIVKDGPLTPEFKKLGATFVWNVRLKEPAGEVRNRVINLVNKVKQQIYHAILCRRFRGTSLVFLNTLANGHIQKRLLFLKCEFVCYVHELQAAIRTITNQQTLGVIRRHTRLFIACSNAVKQNLIEHTGIPAGKVEVFTTPQSTVYRDRKEYSQMVDSFKGMHSLPADAVIIGAAGAADRRKGFDLFLPMVAAFYRLFPGSSAYFIWKGLDFDDPAALFDLYDYEKHAFKDRILLLPHDSKGIQTIACFDIHLLMSREDPYPLVVLEAASFGIPTVCFKNAGGAVEFIEEDSGITVTYGDIVEMAVELDRLVNDAPGRERMGIAARQKVGAKHAKSVCMPEFIRLLNAYS